MSTANKNEVEMTIESASSSGTCLCSDDPSLVSIKTPPCPCPLDDDNTPIHEEGCAKYTDAKILYERDPELCDMCGCRFDVCRCNMAGREAVDEWRSKRPMGTMPAVLESTHPLMKRFQDTLRHFLQKENAIAEEEIANLREEIRLSKLGYDKDLETIYKSDHDTNSQRVLIEEYEATLAQRAIDRENEEKRARENNERYKKAKEQLNQDMIRERESLEEMEALTALCRQLEEWRTETESELTVSQRMSDKMRAEKQARADEKRELDIVIFGLNNEIWKLESKIEMMNKQLEIKNNEMEKINDKAIAYSAELEDLELDKRRLVSLWNSVIGNIRQRDKAYDSVRDDYKTLQENYRTLLSNLEITKKMLTEEMQKGKEIGMNKDKINYDMEYAKKLFDTEDAKRIGLEVQIAEFTESIEMTEKDSELIKIENNKTRNVLKSIIKDFDKKTEEKLKLENEILQNLQECLLNDKAVQHMANGIRKMREMARQQELALTSMENQHAKVLFEIELQKSKHANNMNILEENLAKMAEKEKELDLMQQEYDRKTLLLMKKQRELDIVNKKYTVLKEIFDSKSPQEIRIEELEKQIKCLRERTDELQQEWLRLQSHVVKMTEQHQKTVTDIRLLNKQIQICDEKTMRITADVEAIEQEKTRIERGLRDMRGRLEMIERTYKDASQKNLDTQKTNVALTHEFSANLKDAEAGLIQLQEDIEGLDKEKMDLTQDLDRVQREALVWQRKGIMAVELKRNIHTAKSAAGEISQMKNEIHRMEVRREQLRRTSDKLAEDLAQYVTRRETAMEKSRAHAAVEKNNPKETSQSAYHHKLRLARADVARVTKDLDEAKGHMDELEKEQERLDREISETSDANKQLQEHVADLIKENRETSRMKDWLLERVVRNQRLGKELATAIKRQHVRVHKPKETILKEQELAKNLNDSIRNILQILQNEYPFLIDKFESLQNSLNIFTPSCTPVLTQATECPIEHLKVDFLDELGVRLERKFHVAERPCEEAEEFEPAGGDHTTE